MPKNLRIRTQVGVDKEVTFDLNQDFDMLEILSLNLYQTDVYPKDCANFGVVAGRVLANGGFGVPNAKVSIFVPLDDKDAENPIIKSLYPYKTQGYRTKEGFRYNLLPQTPSYTGHIPTGSFPKLSQVLLNQEVSYVYEKYYKFTAKTNASGDFMLYGVPVGEQTLVVNVDLSDIGCFSMTPEDFKRKGESSSNFNGAKFKSSPNIDELPQIVTMSRTIDIRPLWGDEEAGCGASIIRSDFDLREVGVEIEPTAVFMGSVATDTEKLSVNKNCKPRGKQGELCRLAPTPGRIESIRFTPFFKKEEDPANPGSGEQLVPVLQRFDIDGGFNIDDNGAFLINIPMSLDYLITNEFGERVISRDPSVGIPTKAKHRFRIKPLEAKGTARLRRRGAYLVPNIKEYNSSPNGHHSGAQASSYAFSIDYWDYPSQAISGGEILAAKDYFYEFSYSKVYTPTQFHNHWKARFKDRFIGVKEIIPREEKACDGQAVSFPVNTANKNVNFPIVINQFVTRIQQIFYTITYLILSILCAFIKVVRKVIDKIKNFFRGIVCKLCRFWYKKSNEYIYCDCPTCPCTMSETTTDCVAIFGCLFMRVTKYPECEKCGCYSPAGGGGANNHGNSMGCDAWADDTPKARGTKNNDFMDCSKPNKASKNLDNGCYSLPIGDDTMQDLFSLDGESGVAYIADWRKREVLLRSMCDGLMNYFWTNNYIGGFLYLFQFKAKLKPKSSAPNGYKVKHCAEVVYFHSADQEFYYRSSPYNNGAFIGDRSSPLKNDEVCEGGNIRNLHFPTTIMDLGPVIENIAEICYEDGYSEGCSIANDIGGTTFKPIGEFMFDAVNEIVNYNDGIFEAVNLKTPFQRDATGPGRRRELNGGMATIISQFSEVGVIPYSTPGEIEVVIFGTPPTFWTPNAIYDVVTLGWTYSPPGGVTYPGGGSANMWEWNWPDLLPGGITAPGAPAPGNNMFPSGQPFSVAQSLYPDFWTAWTAGGADWQWYAENTSTSVRGANSNDDSVSLVPQLLSGTTSLQPGVDVRECIVELLDQSSQVVPFYVWDKSDTSQSGFGKNQFEDADWITKLGEIGSGNIQQRMTWQAVIGGTTYNPLETTPIDDNQAERYIALGLGYHYYFGLVPGSTAYDIFDEKYVSAALDEGGDMFVVGN